jgi:hypothetical protein
MPKRPWSSSAPRCTHPSSPRIWGASHTSATISRAPRLRADASDQDAASTKPGTATCRRPPLLEQPGKYALTILGGAVPRLAPALLGACRALIRPSCQSRRSATSRPYFLVAVSVADLRRVDRPGRRAVSLMACSSEVGRRCVVLCARSASDRSRPRSRAPRQLRTRPTARSELLHPRQLAQAR